ncbi:unnamed protein product [Paramecium primaurelia]|uniref:Uncharacterized protein n=2 Tax=Paramecium TaxID=5884 RepID=A0A8S1T2M6_9CILI|nr:unnamed protein product [Paramecium primaurelia]CAD8145948.1 unnamed protein product [Paramecium pentaurelia]
MVFAKIALGTAGAVTIGYIFVPPFNRKLERNVLRPIRNYRRHLQQEDSFKTEEEFYQFLGSVALGTLRMFTIESD